MVEQHYKGTSPPSAFPALDTVLPFLSLSMPELYSQCLPHRAQGAGDDLHGGGFASNININTKLAGGPIIVICVVI